MTRTEYRMPGMCANFSAPPQGEVIFKGPARRACPIVVCGQGGCLSPLLREWWPEVVVAPLVHEHVLVVQITVLLFAVVARQFFAARS